MRADAGEAGRPPDISAVVRGSRGARAEAADECGCDIVRREGGHCEEWRTVRSARANAVSSPIKLFM